MESFSANIAKALLGRNVNLHLKDGAVIINVKLTGIYKLSARSNEIEYTPSTNNRTSRLPARNVAWAELINLNFLQKIA